MITTQEKIAKAYKVLSSISERSFPLSTAFKFYKVKKLLENQYHFQIERETLLIERYHPHPVENGNLACDTNEETQKFSDELKELAGMEVDLQDFYAECVPISDEMAFTVSEIEALDGFIAFIPAE